MKWNHVKGLAPEGFRRLTGVKQSTFEKMVEILHRTMILKKKCGGRPNKLRIEEMLLMTLEY